METPHLPTRLSAVCGELPDISGLSFLGVAKDNPKVQKNWMHSAGCASGVQRSWIRGSLVHSLPFRSGSGFSDNKCLFSVGRGAGEAHDRTSQYFPPAWCCSGSHSLGTGDISGPSSSALAFLPPSPHPEPWPNYKVLKLLFPVRALLGGRS